MEKCDNPANTKVRKKGEEGVAPSTRAVTFPQPTEVLEKTTVEQVF